MLPRLKNWKGRNVFWNGIEYRRHSGDAKYCVSTILNGGKMKDKFRNKYRIKTTRLPNWDYGWNGYYYVTICTKNRARFFGAIYNGIMNLSEIGKIANKYWLEIPKHFPFVKLGSFIVMPDHIHGIIVIDKNESDDGDAGGVVVGVETQNFVSLRQTQKFAYRQTQKRQPKNKFGPQSQNLASIIRGFKIGVTKNAKQINPDFKWQSRFYDNIIRNERSFNNITQYITNNPLNWID